MKKLLILILISTFYTSTTFASISNWGGVYLLDDSDQTTTVDSSGNGNTLSEGGTMDETTPGVFGDATHTNAGSDDWHQAADDSDFDVNTSLNFAGGSWSRWITSIGNASAIMSKGTAYVYVKGTDGKIFLRMNGTNATSATTAISVNTWTYTGFTYTDAAATEVEYWVGTGSTRDGNQNLDVTPTDSATAFFICDDATYEGCNGGTGADIDEVWMAREAVTGADHSSIATNGLQAFMNPKYSHYMIIVGSIMGVGAFMQNKFEWVHKANKHRWKYNDYITEPRPVYMKIMSIIFGWYKKYPYGAEKVGWGPGSNGKPIDWFDRIEWKLFDAYRVGMPTSQYLLQFAPEYKLSSYAPKFVQFVGISA